jgi:hypothetical protein
MTEIRSSFDRFQNIYEQAVELPGKAPPYGLSTVDKDLLCTGF